MNSISRWWDRRSSGERRAIGIVGGVVALATGAAVAYAVIKGGAIVKVGHVLVAVGPAAGIAARGFGLS